MSSVIRCRFGRGLGISTRELSELYLEESDYCSNFNEPPEPDDSLLDFPRLPDSAFLLLYLFDNTAIGGS